MPNGGTVDTTPQVLVNANQAPADAGLPDPPIDFATQFNTMRTISADFGTCATSGVTLTNANGDVTYDPNNIPPGCRCTSPSPRV